MSRYYDSILAYQNAHQPIDNVISLQEYKIRRLFKHKPDAEQGIKERRESKVKFEKQQQAERDRKAHNDKVLKSMREK